jgi:uncharacterized protein (TIGR00251 family)
VGGRWERPGDVGCGDDIVGGRSALVVAVAAPAVDGKANAAVCAAVAGAVGVRARDVRIVSGERSRDKLLEIAGVTEDLTARIAELVAAGGAARWRGR